MNRRRALAVLAIVGLGIVAGPSQATFKGKNGLLVYQAEVGETVQLFTVRPDGGGVRQVTRFPEGEAIDAAWSPDGRRIAFVHITKERGETQRIYTMNFDGTGLRKLDRRLRWAVAWLPGGKRLLVVKGLSFVTVNADGGGFRDAGIPGGLANSPCVFPDGKRVAFLRSKSLGSNDERAIFVGASAAAAAASSGSRPGSASRTRSTAPPTGRGSRSATTISAQTGRRTSTTCASTEPACVS